MKDTDAGPEPTSRLLVYLSEQSARRAVERLYPVITMAAESTGKSIPWGLIQCGKSETTTNIAIHKDEVSG